MVKKNVSVKGTFMKTVMSFVFIMFIALTAYAASKKVPLNFQAVLLSKIIALDNTLQNNEKDTLDMAVFYDPEESLSVKTKNDFIKVFRTLDMYGKPVDTEEVTEVTELVKYDLIYISEIGDKKFKELIELANSNKILTIGVNEEYAHNGCALGFSIVGGRPKVLFNQMVVDEIGADFALQVMLISEVI